MKIKSFLAIIYTLIGLLISAISSFLTYIIIGKPIGMPMVIQIILVIIFLAPIVGIISYYLGSYLSNKFHFIQFRLTDIKNQNFILDKSSSKIKEIEDINENINFLSAQLKHLFKDLKQKNQNLSNLLISMAHDIKTPITILNGYIEEIEDDMISEKELPYALKHMREEIKFLDELTVDMLEFITSMQEQKSTEDINLKDFINYEVFPILPKSKDIEHINEVGEDILISFNKTDLKKICINILTNSIKYTSKGYIKIYTLEKIIYFENSGEKIDEKYKKKIFEPFFTISKSKNRKKSGFGLGLSIVKNLAQNNGYEICLKSSNERQTIFQLKEKKSKN